MLTDGTAAPTPAGDEEIDLVTPRATPATAAVEASTAGPNPLGLRAVRLFGEAGPCGPAGSATTSGEAGAAAAAALDFKLAAAVLRSGGGGGSGSDEDEVSEVSERRAGKEGGRRPSQGRRPRRASLPRSAAPPTPPVRLRSLPAGRPGT